MDKTQEELFLEQKRIALMHYHSNNDSTNNDNYLNIGPIDTTENMGDYLDSYDEDILINNENYNIKSDVRTNSINNQNQELFLKQSYIIVVSLFLISPIIISILEYILLNIYTTIVMYVNNHLVPYIYIKEGVDIIYKDYHTIKKTYIFIMHNINHIWEHLIIIDTSKLSWLDWCWIVIFGVTLNVTIDYDTKKTNTYIYNIINKMYSIYHHNKTLSYDNGTMSNVTNIDIKRNTNYMKVTTMNIYDILSNQSLQIKNMSFIIVCGIIIRCLLSRNIIDILVVNYRIVFIILGLLIASYVFYYWLHHRRKRMLLRKKIVNQLYIEVKNILINKGRAYPVDYVYEELYDESCIQTNTNTTNNNTSTINASNKNTANGNASCIRVDMNTNKDIDHIVDIDITYEGLLPLLWKEVQQVVESKRQIQSIDLIVDGKKQKCWRILSGTTRSNI